LFRLPPSFIPDYVLKGKISRPERVEELFERLLSRWRYGRLNDRTICRGLFLELLLELLCDGTDGDGVSDFPETQLAAEMRLRLSDFAEKPLNKSGSIQNFLEKSGKSYAHQCREFKKLYGISPLGYVNALRATRAGGLLRDTNMNIAEIAERLGFENLSYFTRFFRKYRGKTPSEYRAAGG
jgi:AraC-like DNA-binding protein